MAADRGTPRLYSFADVTVVINRSSTVQPQHLNGQLSSPSSLSLIILAACGSGAFMVLLMLAVVSVIVCRRTRRNHQRRLSSRMKDTVKALTTPDKLPPPLASSNKIPPTHGHTTEKGARVDWEDCVKPDILNSSPRKNTRRRLETALYLPQSIAGAETTRVSWPNTLTWNFRVKTISQPVSLIRTRDYNLSVFAPSNSHQLNSLLQSQAYHYLTQIFILITPSVIIFITPSIVKV